MLATCSPYAEACSTDCRSHGVWAKRGSWRSSFATGGGTWHRECLSDAWWPEKSLARAGMQLRRRGEGAVLSLGWRRCPSERLLCADFVEEVGGQLIGLLQGPGARELVYSQAGIGAGSGISFASFRRFWTVAARRN